MPETVAVNVRNRSHELVVDVTIVGSDQTDGVLLALGLRARRLVAAHPATAGSGTCTTCTAANGT